MGAQATSRADAAAVLDALRRLIRFLRLAERQAESAHGLSAAQLFVVHSLASAPASSLGEIAERTLTDQSSVSTVVARLVERRLVARRPSRDDRRRVELALTATGRKVVSRSPDLAQTRIVAAVAAMPATRRRALVDALDGLVGAVGADRVAARMLFEDGACQRV